MTSISEFCDMYFSQSDWQSTQKVLACESRNQRGLMVYISPKDNMVKAKKVSKINFVDLTGLFPGI